MGSHPQGRLFRFKGNDTQYLEYLERELLQAQKYITLICPSSNYSGSPGGLRPSLAGDGIRVAGKSGSQGQLGPVALEPASPISPPAQVEKTTDNTTCFTGNSNSKVELEFIPFNPVNPSVSPPTQDSGRWKTELNDLLSNIQEARDWGAPVPPEEIDGLLLRYKVQFNSESDGVYDNDKGDKGYDEPIPTSTDVAPEFYSWYKSYYAYAAHTSRALKSHSGAGSRLAFRVVIVSLMCIVLLDVGVSLDTVNSILSSCFPNPEKMTKNTLREYRRGARWVNSRVLQLIEEGWSNRSAELFFRYGRSICQYKQICGNKKSEILFITELRKKGKPVPPLEGDQMPISIPCIIKRYIGKYVSLERICEVLSYKNLSYNYEYTAWIYSRFYSPDSDKTTYPSPPPISLNDDDTGEVKSATETQSSLMLPSGRSEGDISDYRPYTEGDLDDSETTSTPHPKTNQRTDNPQMPADAAETRTKQTNKRPYLAGSDSRDSQRRRLSSEIEGKRLTGYGPVIKLTPEILQAFLGVHHTQLLKGRLNLESNRSSRINHRNQIMVPGGFLG
ncbi:hypothetical protein McanMca71_001841 [Microsporum canis]